MSTAGARARKGRWAHGRAVLGGGVSLFLRRLRFEPGPPLTMFVLVVGTCLLFAALPRLFNAFADDGLRYAVAHAKPLARNVRAFDLGRIPAAGGTGSPARVAVAADRSQQALPASLRGLIDGRTFVVRSSRYILQSDRRRIQSGKGLFRYLTIHLQAGVRSHIRLAAGRLPRASGKRVRAPVTHPGDLVGARVSIPGLPKTKAVPLLEIALSTATARLLRLRVGDQAVFTPDLNDSVVRYVPLRQQQPLAVEVTGLFTVDDPEELVWFGYTTLDTPDVRQGNDLERQDVFAEALVSPDEYGSVLAATRPLPLSYEYRYFVDPDRLDAGGLQTLSGDLARLGARYAGAGPLERRVETGLAPVLDRYRASRSQAETLLAVAAIGLLACALATLGLLGVLSYERRRIETAVSRTRGASPRHVLVAQAIEALLIAVPAGLVGWALAAPGGRRSGEQPLGVARARGGRRDRALLRCGDHGPRPPSAGSAPARRRCSRATLYPPALARGAGRGRRRPRRLPAAPPRARGGGIGRRRCRRVSRRRAGAARARLWDPRRPPLPLACCGGCATRCGSDVGSALHLGLSRAARQSDASSLLPLLVLVLALAIACLVGGDAEHHRAGPGAAPRGVRSERTCASTRPSTRACPTASCRAWTRSATLPAPTCSRRTSDRAARQPLLVALDLPAYEQVVAGTPDALRFPRILSAPSPIPSVVPALVSANWPVLGTFQVGLPDKALSFIPAAERASFPGIPLGTPFAVVSLQALQHAGSAVMPNRVYLGGASAAAVRQSVRSAAPGAVVSTRAAVVRSLRSRAARRRASSAASAPRSCSPPCMPPWRSG